jgi:hypothetical protein
VRCVSRILGKTLWGGAAARVAATPNRAVRMAGGVASTKDDRISSGIGNEIRTLT